VEALLSRFEPLRLTLRESAPEDYIGGSEYVFYQQDTELTSFAYAFGNDMLRFTVGGTTYVYNVYNVELTVAEACYLDYSKVDKIVYYDDSAGESLPVADPAEIQALLSRFEPLRLTLRESYLAPDPAKDPSGKNRYIFYHQDTKMASIIYDFGYDTLWYTLINITYVYNVL